MQITAMTYEELKEKHNSQCKRSNPKHEESKLQRACVTWFRLQYPEYVLFAIPNGGYRNAKEAAIMKAEGVTPGVADLFLMFPRKGYPGLFIEMKFGNGKQSEAQIKFQENASKSGYKYVIANSMEGFMEEINLYIK
jgi:hypothetical protein